MNNVPWNIVKIEKWDITKLGPANRNPGEVLNIDNVSVLGGIFVADSNKKHRSLFPSFDVLEYGTDDTDALERIRERIADRTQAVFEATTLGMREDWNPVELWLIRDEIQVFKDSESGRAAAYCRLCIGAVDFVGTLESISPVFINQK